MEPQLVAQYGNTVIDAKSNALLRGTGKYNPPPIFEQTTDRGNAYVNALNIYENTSPMMSGSDTAVIYEDKLEEWHKRSPESYKVGSTGMHPEAPGSWDRTPFGESEYQHWARASVNQTPSSLLNFFFHKNNIEYIQDRIISEVKRIKKIDVSKQSVDELLIIMRNHYQKALTGWLPHEGNPNDVYPRGETPCSLEGQLSRLNKSVLEETVKQVISGSDMYQQYYKDASSLPLPLTHPTLTTMKGSRVLSENVGFNNGHEFTESIQSYNERFNIL